MSEDAGTGAGLIGAEVRREPAAPPGRPIPGSLLPTRFRRAFVLYTEELHGPEAGE